jgi:putative transposase
MRRSATRQLLLSELDLEHAPDVDAALLGPEEKARHECLKTALLAWWAGTKPKKIEEAYGIKRQSLNYYDKRFFQQHEDGDIQGFRVLRRGTRVDGYVRTKETTQCSVHDGYGTAGAFRQCLKKYPSVKKALDKALQIVAGQDPLSAAINFKDLHRNVFLTALRKAGAPASDYPFCTKTLGYQSVRAYALEVVRNSGASQARLALFGHAALDGWDTGTRKHTWLEPLLPCDLCCYDEQLLPDLGTVSFIVDGTRHVIPMERMSLCLLVSYRPKCILAYHLSMRPRVADADFLETFGNLLTPWVPKTFKATPELSYKPGAGFPNGVVPGFLSAFRIGLLRVDNDMTHYADAVLIYLRARFGMNFEYGKVRRWLTRFAVEQMFAELQVHIAKLASTTGSGPRDRRVNDPVGSALKYEISIEDLRELLEVILANLNGLPRNELYGASALEAMTTAYAPATSVGPALPGYSEDALTRPMPLGIAKVVVHCNEEKSVHPYVEMDGSPTGMTSCGRPGT